MEVTVEQGNLEAALKRLKVLVARDQTLRLVRERILFGYLKPSESKRKKHNREMRRRFRNETTHALRWHH